MFVKGQRKTVFTDQKEVSQQFEALFEDLQFFSDAGAFVLGLGKFRSSGVVTTLFDVDTTCIFDKFAYVDGWTLIA